MSADAAAIPLRRRRRRKRPHGIDWAILLLAAFCGLIAPVLDWRGIHLIPLYGPIPLGIALVSNWLAGWFVYGRTTPWIAYVTHCPPGQRGALRIVIDWTIGEDT